MDRHFALQVAHTVINGPKMGLRCGTQRAAELRARGSIGPQRSGYASCGWIRGPRGPGLFLRMHIVWRGRFCTKIGVFNRGYVGNDRAYPPCRSPELACRLGRNTWYLNCIQSDRDLSQWAGVFAICSDVIRYALVRAHKHTSPRTFNKPVLLRG